MSEREKAIYISALMVGLFAWGATMLAHEPSLDAVPAGAVLMLGVGLATLWMHTNWPKE